MCNNHIRFLILNISISKLPNLCCSLHTIQPWHIYIHNNYPIHFFSIFYPLPTHHNRFFTRQSLIDHKIKLTFKNNLQNFQVKYSIIYNKNFWITTNFPTFNYSLHGFLDFWIDWRLLSLRSIFLWCVLWLFLLIFQLNKKW
jgi:hypothetical protein